MEQPRLKRQSAGAVSVDTNVRCLRVYPTEGTKRTVSDLQTVGIRLTKEQAIHLARVLLVVHHSVSFREAARGRHVPPDHHESGRNPG
jgi:hypothetical protein